MFEIENEIVCFITVTLIINVSRFYNNNDWFIEENKTFQLFGNTRSVLPIFINIFYPDVVSLRTISVKLYKKRKDWNFIEDFILSIEFPSIAKN